MSHSNEITACKINTTSTESATLASLAKREAAIAVSTAARKVTKDAGRVHVGGGMMRF